ncbi:hypothetical protein ACG74X_04140 [Marivita sp. S0852]|uniref:hypothetical protein n=1 Tax=Marivita sp. S0852 TaxID=3373893 RepID=UPI003982B541
MTDPSDISGASPVFHETKTYRRRRIMDAARMAPLLALLLWGIPLLWPQTGDDRVSSGSALIYIFSVWAGVIFVTWVLSRVLGTSIDPPTDPDR